MKNKASILSIDYINTNTAKEIRLPIDVFKKPESDHDYDYLQNILDQLIDEIREDENHPLALAMQIIGENLEQYDNEYHAPIGDNISDIEMVKFLMAENDPYQKDLTDIFGGQANFSKFLNGERALSKSNILGLKEKFRLSTDFFFNK